MRAVVAARQAHMLHLLDTAPFWQAAGRHHALPLTLPGLTIGFLALQKDWVARDRLCTLLWPEAAPATAQHNLRVNLYRVRSLLAEWGVDEAAFEAERRRVRLRLANDVAALRQALAAADDARACALHRQPLLAEAGLAGFPALQEWVELERAELQGAWRSLLLAGLNTAALPVDQALARCQALLRADPLDDEAMAQQIRWLQSAGQEREAQRLADTYRTRLRRELGIALPVPAAPSRDAFVGRELELRQLDAMLDRGGRVVTLTGPGGVGKSRLARELARRCAIRWTDGVAWVALADLPEAPAVLPRLAAACGWTLAAQRAALAQVETRLGRHAGLVVLDNAEHLADLAPLLDRLQRAAPHSAWLLTSRAPLGLAAERTCAVAGLAQPEPGEAVDSAEAALAFDAVRLFCARAGATQPGFDVSTGWRAGVELVRATGGWPLAIEFAAGALAHHSLADLMAELQQSLDMLAAGRTPAQARHDSMRASLAWSWQLLGPAERAALAALSTCRGGFTRAAALAIGACDGVVLVRLLERSLVCAVGGGRFDLHPLVAQFATERLADDAALKGAAERRQARHFGASLQACGAARGAQIAPLLQEIENDFENCRRAWQHLAAAGEAASLGAAARGWSEFSTAKGRARELAQLVASALPATTSEPAQRLALLQASAILHYRAGEFDAARALARDALATATAAGDDAACRSMLNTLALALKDLGRYDEAEACARDGLARARAAAVEREIASHANTCAILVKTRGDHAGAAALYREAIAIHRRAADHRGLAIGLNNLGNVYRALGDADAAQRSFDECLRVSEQHGIASSRAFALVNLALVHQRAGRHALALSFAERARAEPAAEIAVLLGADVVSVLASIAGGELDRAATALATFARRARETGLHAALLEALGCQARLLAARGRRAEAMALFAHLVDHPRAPAMLRDDSRSALHALAPSDAELRQAGTEAATFELDLLIDRAIAAGPPPLAPRSLTEG